MSDITTMATTTGKGLVFIAGNIIIVSVASMITRKVVRVSLGAPPNIWSGVKLTVALGLSTVVTRELWRSKPVQDALKKADG